MIVVVVAIPIVIVLAWYWLFSKTAGRLGPETRLKIWHGLFLAFFVVYATMLATWLAAGIVAAVAHHDSAFHTRLHSYGGAPDVMSVTATDAQPFTIDGSKRIREITLRAGGTARVRLTVEPFGHLRFMVHNISIWRGSTPLFQGEPISPEPIELAGGGTGLQPRTITYEFPAPAAGTYTYRCQIHPRFQQGTVRVLPASAPVTHPAEHQSLRDLARRVAEVSHHGEHAWATAVDYAFSFVNFGLGIFLVALRPRERAARIFGIAMIGTAAAYNLQTHAALALHPFFDDPVHTILHPLTGVAYIYALVVFPDGRLVPRWSNGFGRVVYRAAFFGAAMLILRTTGSILPDFSAHPAALVLTFGMIIPLVGIAAQAYRLRTAQTSEARQQSRLLLWALATSAAFGFVLLAALRIDLSALLHPNLVDPTALGSQEAVAFRVFQPLFVVIPLALFVGILRYRLWDVDLVVNKALVYGTLAGIAGALYVSVVVLLGGAVGGRLGLSLVVTVAVALAFDPLRARLQRVANRLVFGERASPYEVMAEASHRIAGAGSTDETLTAVAEAALRGVGAAKATVELRLPGGATRRASWPPGVDGDARSDRVVDVVHGVERIGEIAVAKRPGDPLRPAENRLLTALAKQVAPALQSVRLAEQLRMRLAELHTTAAELAASRQRLVRAADAERRRLEQEIHGGVERQLIEIADRLADAERCAASDRGRAGAILERVGLDTNETQEGLRELARGIFPPLLSDKGVIPAIESQIRKLGITIEFRTVGSTERFDPRSEAAVYFCCTEALRRIARTPDVQTSLSLVSSDDWVTFTVRERGRLAVVPTWMDDAVFQGLEDRVEALGGTLSLRVEPGEGTSFVGRVPAQVADVQMAASLSGSNAGLLA